VDAGYLFIRFVEQLQILMCYSDFFVDPTPELSTKKYNEKIARITRMAKLVIFKHVVGVTITIVPKNHKTYYISKSRIYS
jgi:hypothetical protein